MSELCDIFEHRLDVNGFRLPYLNDKINLGQAHRILSYFFVFERPDVDSGRLFRLYYAIQIAEVTRLAILIRIGRTRYELEIASDLMELLDRRQVKIEQLICSNDGWRRIIIGLTMAIKRWIIKSWQKESIMNRKEKRRCSLSYTPVSEPELILALMFLFVT